MGTEYVANDIFRDSIVFSESGIEWADNRLCKIADDVAQQQDDEDVDDFHFNVEL